MSKQLLYFTADWCGPCQQIKPVYKELENNYPEIMFSMIDVDKNESLTSKMKVKGMPTFIAICDGVETKRFTGADPSKLRHLVESLLNA
jgi:thiol-disulfide isomerase/thioredoxin